MDAPPRDNFNPRLSVDRNRRFDAVIRLSYRLAYQLARLWWFVRRPSVTGSNAAIWHNDRLLLLKSSYRAVWQLPGGFKHLAEDPCTAALRETKDEIGIELSPAQMTGPIIVESSYEYRRAITCIFEVSLDAVPALTIDNRVIVGAGYFTVDEIKRRKVVPAIRFYLEERSESNRLAATSAGPAS